MGHTITSEHVEESQDKASPGGLLQDPLYQAYASKSPEWHQEMNHTLLRKVDLHLLPFLVLMYFLNFLDRKYDKFVIACFFVTVLIIGPATYPKHDLVHWRKT